MALRQIASGEGCGNSAIISGATRGPGASLP